jgi:hypothetical protein
VRCRDYSKLLNGSDSTCEYWKPGLDDGRQRDFYPGSVKDILRVYSPDGSQQYVIQTNSASLINSEGYHYVSLYDINPAAITHEPGVTKAQAFQQWRSQLDPNTE